MTPYRLYCGRAAAASARESGETHRRIAVPRSAPGLRIPIPAIASCDSACCLLAVPWVSPAQLAQLAN
eukprot:11650860-Alexandrium_andersonii.AAC.1